MATTYTNKIIFQDGIYVNGETPLDDRLVLNSVSDLYITAGKKDCVLYQRAYKGMQITIFDNGEPKEFILKDITPYQKANAVTVNASNYNTYWEMSGKAITERIDSLETSLKKADSDLATRLTNEVETLNETIDTLDSKLDTEISNRTTADTNLTNSINNINSSIGTIKSDIDSLETSLENEKKAREAADTSLNNAVQEINETIGGSGGESIVTQIENINKNIDAIEVDVENLQNEDSSLGEYIKDVSTRLDFVKDQMDEMDLDVAEAITDMEKQLLDIADEFERVDASFGNVNSSLGAINSSINATNERLNTNITQTNTNKTSIDSLAGQMRIFDSSLTASVKDFAAAELVWAKAWNAMREATNTEDTLPAGEDLEEVYGE